MEYKAGEVATEHQHEHQHHDAEQDTDVGVTEKLGETIPLDLTFTDDSGSKITLGEYIDGPTLILPVYFTCPTACNIMMGSLSDVLNRIPLEPGEDYRALALSFDTDDTAAVAARTRNDHMKNNTKEALPENFRFVIGNSDTVKAFTDSIGFRYKKTGKGLFAHPNVLVAVDPKGTVIRYLYGPNFLPFDVSMALTEAERGTPSISVRKVLSYCFSYEPEKKTYSFRLVRILLIAMLLVLGVVMVFLLRKKST